MIRINIMQCIGFVLYTLICIITTYAYKKPVLKFGGSSLANVKKMKNVCNIVEKVIKDEKETPIIVLSAIGDTTNKLLAAGELALLDDGYNNAIDIVNGIKSDHYNILNYAKNHSINNFRIERGMRIAQLVFSRIPEFELLEVKELNDTERGKGGFGSTGLKS